MSASAESEGVLLLPQESLPLPLARCEASEDPRLVATPDRLHGLHKSLPLATSSPDGVGPGLLMVQATAETFRGGLQYSRSFGLGGTEVRLELPLPVPAAAWTTELEAARQTMLETTSDTAWDQVAGGHP